MHRILTILIVAVSLLPWTLRADELTQIIQQDLVTLGYDPGNTEGEATTQTIVAISKFQAENNLAVTGEATPQLAGVIKAAISQKGRAATGAGAATAAGATAAASAAGATAAAPVPDEAALRAAQQACLQQKMVEAQEASQKKRGFARLARAVGRTMSQIGSDDVSREIAELSSDVYTADAIASDFKGAAEDLGLTESDIEACRNPA